MIQTLKQIVKNTILWLKFHQKLKIYHSCRISIGSFLRGKQWTNICRPYDVLYKESRDEVKIGNDCRIGENVFIAGGVSIGDGAVVYCLM